MFKQDRSIKSAYIFHISENYDYHKTHLSPFYVSNRIKQLFLMSHLRNKLNSIHIDTYRKPLQIIKNDFHKVIDYFHPEIR